MRETIQTPPNEINTEMVPDKTLPSSIASDAESSTRVPIVFSLMGFDSNPLVSSNQRIAMMSNFSTSFNVVNIGYVLHILKESPIYDIQRTSLSDSICSSALIAGMVMGQLMGGVLGDHLTRRKAMLIVMCIQMVASLGSSLCCPINLFGGVISLTVFHTLALWRFILGIGCGGVYPLAATLTAEASTCTKDQAKLVALTFSTQGVGFLCAPLLTWCLVSYLSDEDASMIWRIILAAGSLPGIYICLSLNGSSNEDTYDHNTGRQSRFGKAILKRIWNSTANVFYALKYNLKSSNEVEEIHALARFEPLGGTTAPPSEVSLEDDYTVAIAGPEDPPKKKLSDDKSASSLLNYIQDEEDLLLKLMGTAVCWFFFDVLFYGNTLFTPMVLEKAFGPSETLLDTAIDATVLSLMSLPGYFVSVCTIGKYQTPGWVQTQGFFLMALLYGFIGMTFNSLASPGTPKNGLIILYGLTFFFSNYGPNTTTFMMPSLTFSPQCRSTLNGICAACGKTGALLGATLFAPAAQYYGAAIVMLACSVVSLVGLVLTCLSLTVIGQRKKKNFGDHRVFSTSSIFAMAMKNSDDSITQAPPHPSNKYGSLENHNLFRGSAKSNKVPKFVMVV